MERCNENNLAKSTRPVNRPNLPTNRLRGVRHNLPIIWLWSIVCLVTAKSATPNYVVDWQIELELVLASDPLTVSSLCILLNIYRKGDPSVYFRREEMFAFNY
jgi:hypothetical protein